MTIDEAIAKYKEITNTDANCPIHCMRSCDKCAQESGQLVEWLEDYKRIKMLIPIEQALKAEYNKALDEFVNFANTMPTVETDTVKHGSWFLLDECANEGVYCSVCHKKVYKTDYANQKIKSKYCPNCGAIMDLDGE